MRGGVELVLRGGKREGALATESNVDDVDADEVEVLWTTDAACIPTWRPPHSSEQGSRSISSRGNLGDRNGDEAPIA